VSLRFGSLGSGSEGNALVVESTVNASTTRVLVDCGFGKKELESRLAAMGLVPQDISAVLVTHEHSDHVGGVFPAAARYGWAVHLTYGTLVAVRGIDQNAARQKHDIRLIDSHANFTIGNFSVEPIAVPHDAREPVQFVLADADHRLGVLTDIGHPTAHVIRALDRLDGFLLECNHDAKMLASSDYPAMLKRRISGPYGHLENLEAQQIMARIDLSRLKMVVAGHLSQSNNTPELAYQAVRNGLKENKCSDRQADVNVLIADQRSGVTWQSIAMESLLSV
jgi:phosphoribosyl 1,2-cyclic phosphodiesterase